LANKSAADDFPINKHLFKQTSLYLALINPIQYASQSFRIGATTTAAAARIPAWMIKSLVHWNSNIYQSYYIHC